MEPGLCRQPLGAGGDGVEKAELAAAEARYALPGLRAVSGRLTSLEAPQEQFTATLKQRRPPSPGLRLLTCAMGQGRAPQGLMGRQQTAACRARAQAWGRLTRPLVSHSSCPRGARVPAEALCAVGAASGRAVLAWARGCSGCIRSPGWGPHGPPGSLSCAGSRRHHASPGHCCCMAAQERASATKDSSRAGPEARFLPHLPAAQLQTERT